MFKAISFLAFALSVSANRPFAKGMEDSANMKVPDPTSGILYGNGPVLTGTVNLNFIYYGNVSDGRPLSPSSPTIKNLIEDFAKNFGKSVWYQGIKNYYQKPYSNSTKTFVSGQVNFKGARSSPLTQGNYIDHDAVERVIHEQSNCFFDAIEYMNANPDVAAAASLGRVPIKDSIVAATNHYSMVANYRYPGTGYDEGRSPCGSRMPSCRFDAATYLNLNPDLKATLGTNLTAATSHFRKIGINQNRILCLIPPDPQAVYVVVLGKDVSQTIFTYDGVTKQSCVHYCGYHTHMLSKTNTTKIPFAVAIDPSGCDACIPSQNRINSPNDNPAADAMVNTISSEFMEMVTNPYPTESTAWINAEQYELGDMCEWQFALKGRQCWGQFVGVPIKCGPYITLTPDYFGLKPMYDFDEGLTWYMDYKTQTAVTSISGKPAHASWTIGNRKYLIQDIFNPYSQTCGTRRLGSSPVVVNGQFEDIANRYCPTGASKCNTTNPTYVAPWKIIGGSSYELITVPPSTLAVGGFHLNFAGAPKTVSQVLHLAPGMKYTLISNWAAPKSGQTVFVQAAGNLRQNYTFSSINYPWFKYVFTAVQGATEIKIGSSTVGTSGPVLRSVTVNNFDEINDV